MGPFGKAVDLLEERGLAPQVIIPVVPHVRPLIEAAPQVVARQAPPRRGRRGQVPRLQAGARRAGRIRHGHARARRSPARRWSSPTGRLALGGSAAHAHQGALGGAGKPRARREGVSRVPPGGLHARASRKRGGAVAEGHVRAARTARGACAHPARACCARAARRAISRPRSCCSTPSTDARRPTDTATAADQWSAAAKTFTVPARLGSGAPVEGHEIALDGACVELARTADVLLGILDHLLPLRDPADGARHREQHREHARSGSPSRAA